MDPQDRPDEDRTSVPVPGLSLNSDLEQMAERLRELARAHTRWQGLLDAVLAISRDLELAVVLRRIVTTAMELVDARYGALGVLDESGEGLADFIPIGLSAQQVADLAGVELPHGEGLLGHLIHHPEPLRVADIHSHPESVGFPPGHPPMVTLLGIAVTVRGQVYGNLYLTDKRDGQPFDTDDEAVVAALAGAAGVAIENARLYEQVRAGAVQFQRLLLPQLPDLHPFVGAAVYRPATPPHHLGGDWYDALLLPDGACSMIIGDVVGHDLNAAAAMAQVRNMLRALVYGLDAPPSAVLTRLDHTLHAITQTPVTTACLARLEPGDGTWTLRWSTAGHPPPLLLTPDGTTRYLHADPGLPLGVDPVHPRPDHTRPLPAGSTVILFTDGLVEHPRHTLDEGLRVIAETASANADQPLDVLCRTLADCHPSDGRDDMAVLAVRVPVGGS